MHLAPPMILSLVPPCTQMYDDTFNPLGIQGGVVHPPHERTFFCNFETAQVNKVPLIFSSQNHFPL